jgi:D-alanyl-D-alanine carboxypeptidase
MNIPDLQQLANNARSTREAGFTLIIASLILAVFIFIPSVSSKPDAIPVTVEESFTINAFTKAPIEANAAIVYDLVTGETLYEKNADAQLPLASLTKLLTVYAALTVLSPETPITIPQSVTSVYGSRTFSVGQIFTLSDLARLTLTASLNDGAVAIATVAAERENRTQTDLLASAVASLGLSQTYAVNGSGLDVSSVISGAYGSARDLSKLAGTLVEKFPTIAAATTQSFAEAVSAGGTSFKVKNTDPIVDTVPRLLLSKTGYTDLANGNLVLVFDAGILHPIAIVVLGSTQKARFTDGTMLLAATLAHFAGVASL